MSCFLGAGSCSVDKDDDTSDSDVENIGSGMWKIFFFKTFKILSFSFIKLNTFQEVWRGRFIYKSEQDCSYQGEALNVPTAS